MYPNIFIQLCSREQKDDEIDMEHMWWVSLNKSSIFLVFSLSRQVVENHKWTLINKSSLLGIVSNFIFHMIHE